MGLGCFILIFIFGIPVVLFVVYKVIKRLYPLKFQDKNFRLAMRCAFLAVWFSIFGIVNSFVTEVCIISKPKNYDHIFVFGSTFSYQDSKTNVNLPIQHGEKYIFNNSDEDALFFPVAYGTAHEDVSEVVVIKKQNLTKIFKFPDYFFEEIPSSVVSNSSGEIKYILDWSNNILKKDSI